MKRLLGKLKRAVTGYRDNNFDTLVSISAQVERHHLCQSALGKEVSYYTVGNGENKILFLSGTHGNEVGTVKLAHLLTNWLYERKDRFTDAKFFIVPCLNRDGYEAATRYPDYWNGGRVGRFNGNDVDLNRNFPTKSFQPYTVWTHGKNYTEETKVYGGPSGGSEPEIAGLIHLIKKEKISTYIAFHSAGADVMGNNTTVGQKLARLFSDVSGYKFTTLEDWLRLKQTGTAREWCDENKIAYLEIEATTRWGSDWRNQKAALEACVDLLLSS